MPEPLVPRSAPPVAAHHLTKRFGGVVAVDDVDLVVETGEIHGLLGPNGAGKTTILAMLFGLVEPDGGSLSLFGRHRRSLDVDWLDGVGGFIETPHFYPYLSGRRNLEHLARLDGGRAPDLVDGVIGQLGLGGVQRAKVRTYSLGMRQRLGLAGSLLRSPRLVILDEPGNGLDPAGARDLWGSLRRLAESGTAVLLSSHDMGAIEDVCDSITVLRGGRAVFDGTLPAMRAQAPDAAYRLETSDDRAAIDHAGGVAGVSVEPAADSFLVHAERGDLDAYVIGLGRDGIAVRSMVLEVSPLESLFFRLTEGPVMEDRARRPGRLPGRDGPLIGSRP